MSNKLKRRVPRGDKMIEDCYVMLQKITKMNYGDECEPHDEECCICSAYLLLREFKRLHFYETN